MNAKCENYRLEMDDYLMGELDQAADFRAHIETCAECALALAELDRENGIYADFYEQTSHEPALESWIAIRDRIRLENPIEASTQGAQGGAFLAGILAWLMRPVVLQQAAFALVLIAVSVVTTLYFVRDRQKAPVEDQVARVTKPVEKATVAPVPTPVEVSAVEEKPVLVKANRPVRTVSESDQLAAQVARAEREYLNAIKLLDRAIAKRRDELDPAVMKQYEASLALIDESIRTSRNAFRQNRNDLNASSFLIAAYSRKVELMQDIAMR